MIKNALSKTQIDRLGDRLKKGSHSESDLRLLEDYRRSFGEAYEAVLRMIRQLNQSPTGRLAKSTRSIMEKLCRESIRLSQMQDIAGCRIVVAGVVEQEQFVASLRTVFPGASVIDRRDKPSYGYRAVHVIAEISGKPVEIQIRTALQHMWAELSEKASDVLDPTIKYGGGPDEWRNFLTNTSKVVASYEKSERNYLETVATHEELMNKTDELLEHHLPDYVVQAMQVEPEALIQNMNRIKQKEQEVRKNLAHLRNGIADFLKEEISGLDKLKEQKQ